MPAPQASQFSQLARLSFRSTAPGGVVGRAVQNALHGGTAPGGVVGRAVQNALHGGTAPGGVVGRAVQNALRGGQGLDYEVFIDRISEAICSAWSVWQSAATMVGVTING